MACGPSLGGRPAFGDDEDDVPIRLLLADDLIPGFPYEIGNIDPRERVGAAHLQVLADRDALEGLARLQGGQGAFEAGEIKQGGGQERNMAKDPRQVN